MNRACSGPCAAPLIDRAGAAWFTAASYNARMLWTVVVPGALLPAPVAADVVGTASAPELARLARCARLSAPQAASTATRGAAHWGWLWRRFGGGNDAPVTAPYAWNALGAGAAPGDAGTLWQAEPLHFDCARDHLLALPLAAADALADDEARALAAAAQECARAADAQLQVIGDHWFLRFEHPLRLQTAAPEAVYGAPIRELASGADGARWTRLLNEIQIAWHDHAVNRERRERGLREVNALWLHGGGAARALPECGLRQVASGEPALRGWALAAGVPADSIRADAELDAAGDALALWPHLLVPAAVDAWEAWRQRLGEFDAWLGPLVERAFGRGAEVELLLAGRSATRALRCARSDRWFAWRRATLAAALLEPQPQP
jgi:hypothetical protein